MTNPIDIEVGKRIYDRRKLRGLSQKDVGNAAGVSWQQIAKYEQGVTRVSISRGVLIAETLGMTIDEFVRDLGLHKCI